MKMIINFNFYIMELSKEKVMPVERIKTALAQQEKSKFVFAFGDILLRALRKQDNYASTVPQKMSFYTMVNMADFVIDNRLYEEVLLELEEKSWIEKKITNFLQKHGWYTPLVLDLNDLLTIGSTHYWVKNWGFPENFKKDMQWFANELA